MTQLSIVAPLVWLNSHPGVGKLTIAKEMASQDERVLVISNHSLIAPVAKLLDPNSRDHSDYQKLRKAERARAFEKYVFNAEFKDKIIVCTDSQSDSELGRSVANEYKVAAQQAGRPFMPYVLACDFEENMWRATSDERKASGTTKLTDDKMLQSILTETVPLQFEAGCLIRVTCDTPEQTADGILFDCDRRMGTLRATR